MKAFNSIARPVSLVAFAGRRTMASISADRQLPAGQTNPNGSAVKGASAGQQIPIECQIPTFENKYEQRAWSLNHMAGAFRSFARKGFTEGIAGHISIRDPVETNTFWINPIAVHYGMLRAADMVHVDQHGNVLGGSRRIINLAGFIIHSQIHMARPDVHAVCHTHSVHGRAFATYGTELQMLCQDACNFYKDSLAVYHDYNGVVYTEKEGHNLADAAKAPSKACILRDHGLLTMGGTVDEAAYLYQCLERCCEVQLMADAATTGLGKKPIIISDDAAEYTSHSISTPKNLYMEMQPDYQYELKASDGDFLLSDRERLLIMENKTENF